MYILCYVDDILVFHHNSRPDLYRIDQFMKLKEFSVGEPDIYLGAKFNFFQMSNNVWFWSLSPSKYVQEAVQNCQNHLKENYSGKNESISNAPNPFPLGYKPEVDVSPFLSPDKADYYQTIIGAMMWMV